MDSFIAAVSSRAADAAAPFVTLADALDDHIIAKICAHLEAGAVAGVNRQWRILVEEHLLPLQCAKHFGVAGNARLYRRLATAEIPQPRTAEAIQASLLILTACNLARDGPDPWQASLPIGCEVMLHSLTGRADLNGRRGVVVAPLGANARVGVLVEAVDAPIALRPTNLDAAPRSVIAAPAECALPLRRWRDTCLVWQSPTADSPTAHCRATFDLARYLPGSSSRSSSSSSRSSIQLPVSGVHHWISHALPPRFGDPPEAAYDPDAFDPHSRVSCLLVSKVDGRCVPLKKLAGHHCRAADAAAAASGVDVSVEPCERRDGWSSGGWQDNCDGGSTWAFSARRYNFSAAFGVCAACASRSYPRVSADFLLYPPELAGGQELLVLSLAHIASRAEQFNRSFPPWLEEQERLLTVLPWE